MSDSGRKHHKSLTVERWAEYSLAEQMANIGSEIHRALNWKNKNRQDMSNRAVERALELLDLSLDAHSTFPRLKEIARVREAVVDFFYGANEYGSSEILWRQYFDRFNRLARQDR